MGYGSMIPEFDAVTEVVNHILSTVIVVPAMRAGIRLRGHYNVIRIICTGEVLVIGRELPLRKARTIAKRAFSGGDGPKR
jgi:hypothetical protein